MSFKIYSFGLKHIIQLGNVITWYDIKLGPNKIQGIMDLEISTKTTEA